MAAARGLVIAAPRSGSGKTAIALGLIRSMRDAGLRVAAAKVGPDYIDPTYLAAAAGRPCRNLDSWAMRPATLAGQLRALAEDAAFVICEGAMGLFDGAGSDNGGSTADIAALTGWPVVLVVDAQGQGASVGALIEGFARHRRDVSLAGAIFNRVASARHAAILDDALARALPEVKRLGAVPGAHAMHLPSRHLGLVPAGERGGLERLLGDIAALVREHVEGAAILDLAKPSRLPGAASRAVMPPLGARIAVARDDAFLFAYPSTLEAWQAAGAALTFFSPLADEAPPEGCDSVYLPGGYPELFAARLAGNRRFLESLRGATARGVPIYGECGGYMVLGRSLVDAAGETHEMAGLLPVATSFAAPKLHLGYRQVALAAATPFGRKGASFRGHEFHYASIAAESGGTPLFMAADVDGNPLGAMGQIAGTAMGSFAHLIDRDRE